MDVVLNRVIRFAMDNKLAIWILTILVIFAGMYSGSQMNLETIPNINAPVLSITTQYPGASPDKIEKEVTEPIEKRIRGLSGVEMVYSTSAASISSIQVEYSDYDQDMDQAVNDIKEEISKIDLPENINQPEVEKISFQSFPVISLSVSTEKESLETLTKRVEEDFVPVLEGIDGVNSVEISGQQVEEIQLQWKEDQLKKYQLDSKTVEQIVQGGNFSSPLGLFTVDQQMKSIVIDGKMTTLEDLKNLEIPVVPNNPSKQQVTPPPPTVSAQTPVKLPVVKLKDIADLKLVKTSESISKTNGKNSIAVQVVKTVDANTVNVVEEVKEKMKEFDKKYSGFESIVVMDQGEPIQDSVNTMVEKALLGALFAVIIILIFLRDFRSTLISVVSIPLSLLIALLVLKLMDFSLNIMTLGAMTVAIGRVVDDSIVVIENVYRRMTLKGEKLKGGKLIQAATHEMFIPILSSTIVTIAVFLPLGLVTGPVGELFYPFALTIVSALLASLLVAITLVPMMAHSFYKKGVKAKKHKADQPNKLAVMYRRVLNGALNYKWLSFGLSILLLIGSFFLVPYIGVSFIPTQEEKLIMVTYDPSPGETLEDVKRLGTEAEKYFTDKKLVNTIQYSVGGKNPLNPVANNQALFYVEYDKKTKNFVEEQDQVLEDLQKLSSKGEWDLQDLTAGGTNSNTLSFYIYGDSMKEISSAVDQVLDTIKKQPAFTNVDSNITESYEQYTLVVDHEKMSQTGLTAGQVAQVLANTGEKPVLTTIEKDDKELNVYIENHKKEYKNVDELMKQTIPTATGIEVPLKEIAKVEEGKSPHTLTKRNGKYYAEVTAKIKTNDVTKASAEVKQKIDQLDFPSGVSVEIGGVTEQIQESFQQLGLAMLAAVAIVYFILVLTFGGGLAPFSILFSLPFAVIGGLVGLYLTGETISVSALIGALMLIGIVVTNAIVLIDRVIRKEQEGLSTREALLEAGMTRLRPILMTAIATICALLPLVFGSEGGALISRGLAVTVVGGLTSSTLLTLIIVPVVYEFLMKFRRKTSKSNA